MCPDACFISCTLALHVVKNTTDVDLSKLRRAFSFLSTVSSNASLFKKREVQKANIALDLNRRLNYQSKDQFLRLIRENWIRNAPITVSDIQRGYTIYGPPVPSLKEVPDTPHLKKYRRQQLFRFQKSYMKT